MKLALKDLGKVFLTARGRVTALAGVSIEIPPGEFFVIVGPSGCGKSTLLNLVAGLEKPTAGEIWFGSTLVASAGKRVFVSARDRNVAMVFQTYALYPHLTVFENIAFPLRIKKFEKKKIEESVKSAAAMLEISGFLGAKPAELSGGERQRVAIARAIVRNPCLFLLDEPLSNLDAKLRLATRSELKSLQRTIGTTTVYVTHDQVEAMTLGDRIAVMKDGIVQQVGTPDEIYGAPANPFVATFVGSPPMSLIEAKLSSDEGEFLLSFDGVRIKVPPSGKERARALGAGSCLMGVRAEDVTVVGEKVPAVPTFSATVVSVETLGRERLVHLRVGRSSLSAFCRERFPEAGAVVEVAIDGERIHLFPASEKAD